MTENEDHDLDDPGFEGPVRPDIGHPDIGDPDIGDPDIGDPDIEDPDIEDADDALLAELRSVVGRVDPVPPGMVAAARAGFGWRTIDAELARLTHDSVVDTDRMALVRGVGAPELLTFEGPGLTVEVETLATAAGGLRLLGQLVPAQAGQVEIRHAGGTTTVDADAMGRFAAEGVRTGPVSLRCRAGASTCDTDWFLA
jgi:hypothetical protein